MVLGKVDACEIRKWLNVKEENLQPSKSFFLLKEDTISYLFRISDTEIYACHMKKIFF